MLVGMVAKEAAMPKDNQPSGIVHPDRQTLADPSAARNNKHPTEIEEAGSQEEEYPAGSFPPFDDPAYSPDPATPPVRPDAPEVKSPPKDTEFAGHPDFSQDAGKNKPPRGMGLTEKIDETVSKTGKSEGVNVPVSPGGVKPNTERNNDA